MENYYSGKKKGRKCPKTRFVNPLPDMPILDSSNSAANKDLMEKSMDRKGYNYLLE